MNFSWHQTPAIQLDSLKSDLHLFHFGSQLDQTEIARDLLELPDLPGQLKIYDEKGNYVTQIDPQLSTDWQILDLLRQDIDSESLISQTIPIYLPVPAKSIQNYLRQPNFEVKDLTQVELMLDYLKIANYVQNLTQLDLYATQIADYFQLPEILRMMMLDLTYQQAIKDWYQYFQNYPIELSQLILSKFHYNLADIVYHEARPQFKNISMTSLSNKFSTYHLIKLAINMPILFDNPFVDFRHNHNFNAEFFKVCSNLLSQGRKPDESIRYIGREIMDNVISDNKLVQNNPDLVTRVLDSYFTWDDLSSRYANLLRYCRPSWALKKLDGTETNKKILLSLSKNRYLTEHDIEVNIDLLKSMNINYWNNINKRSMLSIDFLRKTWSDNQYHWQLIFLAMNQSLDQTALFDFFTDNLTNLEQFDQILLLKERWRLIELKNPYWTWSKYHQQLEHNFIKIDRSVLSQGWLQLEDILTVLKLYSTLDTNNIWNNFIAKNPNLTEEFIKTHLTNFCRLIDDIIILDEIAKHPSFTSNILYNLSYNYDDESNLKSLLQNPNFGLKYWLGQAQRDFPQSYQILQNETQLKMEVGDFDNIFEYFSYFEN